MMKTKTIAAALGAGLLCLPMAGAAQPAPASQPGEAAFRAMFKEMIETDTSVDTGDCTLLANRIATRMKAAGFPAENLHVFVPDGAPKDGNLVAILPGKDPKAKAVLMLGHIDVVNAHREDWTRDPFTLIEENGQFYGRGVSDMKSQDAIWADTIVRYAAEKYRPTRTIKMALTCGEEGGFTPNGAGWLAQNQRELIDAGISLTEGGGGDLSPDGKKLAITVMAAEKSGGNFLLEATGPGGHSSKPRPDNIIIEMGKAVGNLQSLEFPTQLNEFNRPYFTTLSTRVDPALGGAMKTLLADPQNPAANAAVNRFVSYHAMLRTTCIPTLISGGHAANAQPQSVKVTINCRTLPGTPLNPVRDAIVKALDDPKIKVTTVAGPGGTAKTSTPPLSPALMEPITAVAKQIFPGVPVTPIQETFGTDSSKLIAVGIPTWGFSGLFRGDDAGNIHGLNEHISVQSVMDGREFMYRLIKLYAEQK